MKKTVMAAVVVCGLFVVVELLCRGFGLAKKADADFSFYVRHVDNDIEQPFIIEDPLVMWRPKPGYNDSRIAINAEGFRDRMYPYRKPAGVMRILCLGDSSTFGYGVPIDRVYHSLLETMPVRGARIEAINAGVTGYTIRQAIGLYRERGARYQPDIVTFYGGVNEPVARFHLSDAEIMRDQTPRSFRIFVRRVLVKMDSYRVYRKFVSSLVGRKRQDGALVPRVDREAYREGLRELHALCRADHAQLVLISPPLCKEASGSDRWLRIHEYRMDMTTVAAEEGIPLLVINEMTEDSPAATAPFFLDGVHPNVRGHGLIMERLYKFLIAQALLPGGEAAVGGERRVEVM